LKATGHASQLKFLELNLSLILQMSYLNELLLRTLCSQIAMVSGDTYFVGLLNNTCVVVDSSSNLEIVDAIGIFLVLNHVSRVRPANKNL